MKTYYFNEEIGRESSQKLIDFLNENDKVKLYWTCTGGECWEGEVLLDLINKRVSEIVALGWLYSMGFTIFYKSTCKKSIHPDTTGMCHQTGRKIYVQSNGKCDDEGDAFYMAEAKKQLAKDIKWLKKLGLNKDEISRYKNNKDVYFSNSRLKEFIKSS